MKGKVVEPEVDPHLEEEDKKKRKVSFDAETLDNEKSVGEIEKNVVGSDNIENTGEGREEKERNKVVLVEQLYSEPVEEFDLAYKEDLVKMKEMGLPLGFLNVSAYEVDANNGLVEVPLKGGGRGGKGKRKKKTVIEEEMRDEFDREWWPQYGDARVMEVWQERYGQFMEGGEEEEAGQEWQTGLDNDCEGTLEEQWKDYDANIEDEGEVDSQGKADADGGVAGWEGSKDAAVSEGKQGWGEENIEPTSGGSEISTSAGWGAVDAPNPASSGSTEPIAAWGQEGGGSNTGWGEAVGVALPDSSSASSVVGEATPAQEEWGSGKQGVGEGWGEVSTWGVGGGGGQQSDWDRLWVEVTNEVYQAELVRWVGEKEGCDQIVEEMDKCKVVDDVGTETVKVNPTAVVNDSGDKKNEKWHKQKIVSGLEVMLKQLKGECEECGEDEEDDFTEVIETENATKNDSKADSEVLKEPADEIVESDEAPGLAKALKAFDQLGYVFEIEAGERFAETPAIRYVTVF